MIPFLAGVVLLLGVIGVCLYPVPRPKGQMIVGLLAVGFGGMLLLESPLLQRSPLDLPLAVLILVAVVGTPWRSPKWPMSVVPEEDGDSLIGSLTMFGFAGLAAHTLARSLAEVLPWLGVAFAGTVYYQVYWRVRSRSVDMRMFWKHMRAQGTLNNPLFTGGLLATLVVLSLSLRQYWCLVMMAPALVLTRSRAAFLGAIIGGGFVFGWHGLTGSAIVLGSVIALDTRSSLRELRYDWMFGRGHLFTSVLIEILFRPWLGYGQNTLRVPAHDQPGKTHYYTHNGSLYYAHAWGLPGLAAYLWVMGAGLFHTFPPLLPALVAYLVFEQFAWPFYGSGTTFWFLLGLGVAT